MRNSLVFYCLGDIIKFSPLYREGIGVLLLYSSECSMLLKLLYNVKVLFYEF